MDATTIFLDEVEAAKKDIQNLHRLQNKLIKSENSIKEKIAKKERENATDGSLDELQTRFIQIRAQTKYVADKIENLLSEQDKIYLKKSEKKRPLSMCDYHELGTVFKYSTPMNLTRSDVDFEVQCIKQIFNNYICFQFKINNTLDDQLLEEIFVEMNGSDEDFELVEYTPCSQIQPHGFGTTSTLVRLSNNSTAVTGTLACTMKFKIKDLDPVTGEHDDDEEEGVPDEFVLDNVEITISDYITRALKMNWSVSWDAAGKENELGYIYTLSVLTLEDYIERINSVIELQIYEPSNEVVETTASDTFYLAGIYQGGYDILFQVRMVLEGTSIGTGTGTGTTTTTTGITIHLTIRSNSRSAVQSIASAIAHIDKQ